MANTKDVSSGPLNASPNTQSTLPRALRKCPVYFAPNEEHDGYIANIDARLGEEQRTPEDLYNAKLCELTGTQNNELANHIIREASYNICGHADLMNKKNIVLQSLAEQQPKDAHEARLCAQATALYSQGMDYLEKARGVLFDTETFAKQDWHKIFMKTAARLLDLHTKTVTELARYKQKGEQRIVVQHVHVNDGGRAIVGGMLTGGGTNNKSDEVIPC